MKLLYVKFYQYKIIILLIKNHTEIVNDFGPLLLFTSELEFVFFKATIF